MESKPGYLQGVETSQGDDGWFYVLDYNGTKYEPIGPYRTNQLAMQAGREELSRMREAGKV